MKATLISRSETYSLEGEDETGLIPEKATHVNVGYDENGKIQGIFFSKKYGSTSDKVEIRRRQDELDTMNPRMVPTQETMREIAGLLKKLSDS